MKVLRVTISSDRNFIPDLRDFFKSLGFRQNGKDFVMLEDAKISLHIMDKLIKELIDEFDYEEPLSANDIFWVFNPVKDRAWHPNITVDRHVSGKRAVLALKFIGKS
mgnify:CR=1 FL=1